MTGIDFGFGALLAYSITLVLAIPVFSIATIHQFYAIKKHRLFITAALFAVFAFGTLIFIRALHHRSFRFLLLYLALLAIAMLLKRMHNKARNAK